MMRTGQSPQTLVRRAYPKCYSNNVGDAWVICDGSNPVGILGFGYSAAAAWRSAQTRMDMGCVPYPQPARGPMSSLPLPSSPAPVKPALVEDSGEVVVTVGEVKHYVLSDHSKYVKFSAAEGWALYLKGWPVDTVIGSQRLGGFLMYVGKVRIC